MNHSAAISKYLLKTYFYAKPITDNLVGILNNYLHYYINAKNVPLDEFREYFEDGFNWWIDFIKSVDAKHLLEINNQNTFLSVGKLTTFSQILIQLKSITFQSKMLKKNPVLISEFENKNPSFNKIFKNPTGISIVFALDLEKKKELIDAYFKKRIQGNQTVERFYAHYLMNKKQIFHENYNADQLVIDITKNKNPTLWVGDFLKVANQLSSEKELTRIQLIAAIKEYNEDRFDIFYPEIFSYSSNILKVKNDKKKYKVPLEFYLFVNGLMTKIKLGQKLVKLKDIIQDLRCVDDLLTMPDAHIFKKKYLLCYKKHFWTFSENLKID